MMLKIRNGGSWVLRDRIARVSFGNSGEGRVRRLRDDIKTAGGGRWSIRANLAVGRGVEGEYTDFEPDVVYLDPDRDQHRLAGTLELHGRNGAQLTPESEAAVAQLVRDGLLDAEAVEAAKAQVRAAMVAVEDYEYPAWCSCVLDNGEEVFYAFSEAYLLNDDGKTIERIR